MLKSSIVTAVALVLGMSGAASAVTVAGTANPYLAGATDGTGDGGVDKAPAQSPVLGALVNAGDILNFTVADGGLVGTSTNGTRYGPDGAGHMVPHIPGAQNGISEITAPSSSLVGVFLNDSVPMGTAPLGYDFSEMGLDFTSLAPSLWQIFFIGDGFTTDGTVQDFIVPDGATRLFLGTMDGADWHNNTGWFEVTITEKMDTVAPVPLPAAALLLLSGLGGLVLVRRRA